MSTQDDYHEYFLSNWILATAGRDSFVKHVSHDRMAFRRATTYAGPLRAMSQCIFALEDALRRLGIHAQHRHRYADLRRI